MIGLDGKTWIIDPTTYYGHPEADIAMTKLFGGFASAFYETYFACADLTLTPGYQDRKDLYNLYHLIDEIVDALNSICVEIRELNIVLQDIKSGIDDIKMFMFMKAAI